MIIVTFVGSKVYIILDDAMGIFIEYHLKRAADPDEPDIASLELKLNRIKFEHHCQRTGSPEIPSQFVFTTNQAQFIDYENTFDKPPTYAEAVSQK